MIKTFVFSRYVLLIFLVTFALISCKKNHNPFEGMEDQIERGRFLMEKSTSEYDEENDCIYFSEVLQKDIIANVEYDFTIDRNNLLCEFSFYNYGGNLQLQNGMRENIFTQSIGKIDFIAALSKENNDININSDIENSTYGKGGICQVIFPDGYYANAIITPLAYRGLVEDGLEDSSLIFVSFISDNQYMNVIFKGGPQEWLIVDMIPNRIFSRNFHSPSSAIRGGYGLYWSPIN